ncbi:helix-turn-helix domain-containing protein [Aureibacillus halotolerans]|uniref:AraC-like DNA-binding protein n=1 Tax=Aureibacillus halotolerans TaxID=1508390 RepID=A0A4R6TZP0_9BACI|nr:helix-turn-helix domain-containing protein [Aureibacillus halotolerans]TDQ39111.1 AraC-like DNA-binding protein [Aureibacillus halotolerans]
MYYEDIRLEQPFLFTSGYFNLEEHEQHIHDSLEVGLVLENEMRYQFSQETYIGKPGDVFVCRPFEPHWGSSVNERKSCWNMLLFVPSLARLIPNGYQLLIPFYTDWLPSPLIPASSSHAISIAKSFQRASQTNDQPLRQTVKQAEQFLCLLDILLQIYDYASSQKQLVINSNDVQPISHSVQYLLQHFTEDVSIDTLMELSGEKRSRYFQSFQTFTGTSPHQLLLRLRVQHAMDELLRSPEHSILQISEESGFQSLRTFNKQFKSYSGMTPSQYRKTFNR